MYTLVTFVPAAHTEGLLEALFAAGAGRLGDYDRCAFVVRGEGRFRPLPGAIPTLGSPGEDERVVEDRIECVLEDSHVDTVLDALRRVHPYEVPAVYLTALDERCLSKKRGD